MSGRGLAVSWGSAPSRQEYYDLGIHSAEHWVSLFAGTDGGTVDRVAAMLEDIPRDVNVFVRANGEYAVKTSNGPVQIGDDLNLYEAFIVQLVPVLKPLVWQGRTVAVGNGNELDLWHLQPPMGPPNATLTPEFAGQMARVASPHLRATGIQCVLSSVASPWWPDYLEESARVAGGAIDAVDLHLYMKKAGGFPPYPDWQSMEDALAQAHRLTGRPVYASEAGVKPRDMGGWEQKATWTRNFLREAVELPDDLFPACMLFAYSDAVGSPEERNMDGFGLYVGDGTVGTPALAAWKAEMPALPAPEPSQAVVVTLPAHRFELGFARWAMLEPWLIGEPVEKEQGFGPNCSLQETTNGLLFYGLIVDRGKVYGFRHRNGRRFEWRDDWVASREWLS